MIQGEKAGRCESCAFWATSREEGWGLCEIVRALTVPVPVLAGGAVDDVGSVGYEGLFVVARTHREYGCVLGEFGSDVDSSP